MTDKPKPQKYEDLLMQAFEFDEAALEANASGKLSEYQAGQITDQARSWLQGSVLLLVTFGLLLLFWGVLFRSTQYIGLLAIVLAVAGYTLYEWWRWNGDIQRRGVKFVEGRVQLDVVTGSNARFVMQVSDQRFTIGKAKFLALKNGDPYRIYYLPRTKTILSVEWLLSYSSSNPFVDDQTDTAAVPH